MDGTTYIGYTSNVEKRLSEHNAGKTPSIKRKIPYKLVYTENYNTKTEARKREYKLKSNSWKKEQLYLKVFGKKHGPFV